MLSKACLIHINRVESILKQLFVLVEIVPLALGKGVNGSFAVLREDKIESVPATVFMTMLYDFLKNRVQIQVHIHAQNKPQQILDQCWGLLYQGVFQQILVIRVTQLAFYVGVLNVQ